MPIRPKQNPHKGGHKTDLARASMVDDIAEFTKFREDILPFLRKAIQDGLSAEEIYKRSAALAAARGVSIAVTEVDSGKALSAVRDILDRAQGKAKEQKTVTHKFEDLTDDELDAMLVSEAEDDETQKPDQPPLQ